MAFSAASSRHDNIAAINITPLVDVMLVLLVIFMIAAPVVTREIKLDLPGVTEEQSQPRIEPIVLRINAAGELTWNGNPTPLSALPAMLSAEAQREHPAMLNMDVSMDADYGVVAKVLAAANNAEMKGIRFLR